MIPLVSHLTETENCDWAFTELSVAQNDDDSFSFKIII